MTQPPGETPDPLAKHVPPSGQQPPPAPGPPPTSPYVTPGGPQGPPPPYQGYGQPAPPPYPAGPYAPGMPGYPFAQAHTGANTAMGLGIGSVVCAVLTFFCCFTFVGTLAGPFAIALAVRARKEMAQSPGLYNNEGAAMTGLVTGIVGTVLGLIGVAVAVFFVGSFLAIGSGY